MKQYWGESLEYTKSIDDPAVVPDACVSDCLLFPVCKREVLLCLAFSNHALIWVVVFVFVKDAILGIGSIYMHRRGIVAQANWFGKVSCFVSVLCSLILIIPFSVPLAAEVVIALGAAIVAVNLCALVSYAVVFFRTAFKRPKVEKNPKR